MSISACAFAIAIQRATARSSVKIISSLAICATAGSANDTPTLMHALITLLWSRLKKFPVFVGEHSNRRAAR
jgi:hypothetical protein